MAEKQRKLPEDVVEYRLFPVVPDLCNDEETRQILEESVEFYLTHLSPYLIDYIWQNEGFSLRPVPRQGNIPAHLLGQTNFGDNIEDEWFIVFLVFQLTKKYNGLVATVCDSDEEFLLIEAADVLPKWLSPDTAENRVYIYKGQLHVIPIPQSPADVSRLPSSPSNVGDGVQIVRKSSDLTCASSDIQKAINDRIKGFPEKIEESFHYAHCYVPAALAAVLQEKPQLIAPAVTAFYYRDPIDLKCCRTMTYFRPGTRVISRVKFTRCLYAQLMQQNFQPDKRSGFVLPSTSNPKYKSHDLGMKLAHGFEILCSKVIADQNIDANGHRSIPTSNVKWKKYVRSLQDKNYFRGELEGSRLYNELLDSAWKFYQENLLNAKGPPDSAGKSILSLLKTVHYDIEEMRRAESSLKPPDDDSWLNLSPETLETMLKKRSSANRSGTSSHSNSRAAESFDLSQIADSMKTFVDKVSGIDGAQFPGEDDDDDGDVQFESSGFINAMQKMFEFEDTGSESSSDMDEYGWDDSDDEPASRAGAKIKRPPSLDKYMDLMDKELAKTDVGKSFEKQAKPKTKPKPSPVKPSGTKKSVDEEDDDFQPVDVDLNTVKNMLESYGAQEGLPGPASNILHSMGVAVPPNQDLDAEYDELM